MSDIEGWCLCGAVRFAVTPPTLFFASTICPGEIHVALPRFDTDDPGLAKFRVAPR